MYALSSAPNAYLAIPISTEIKNRIYYERGEWKNFPSQIAQASVTTEKQIYPQTDTHRLLGKNIMKVFYT